MREWWAIAGVGMTTLIIRASFLVGPERLATVSGKGRIMLDMVPAAALGALALPALVTIDGELTLDPARLVAGMAAMLVAWRWRSILLTLVAGIATIMLMELLLG